MFKSLSNADFSETETWGFSTNKYKVRFKPFRRRNKADEADLLIYTGQTVDKLVHVREAQITSVELRKSDGYF